ncbi:MAG: hypothetical protein AB1941_01875 [Gemmatimonadota bacterium]
MPRRTFAPRLFGARTFATLVRRLDSRPPALPSPPTGGVLIDGVDVGAFGISVTGELTGWREGPAVTLPTRQLAGGLALAVTGRRVLQLRACAFAGVIEGDTPAQVDERWAAFLYHVAAGERARRITLVGREARHYRGFYNAARSTPAGVRILAPTVHEVRVSFDCTDPHAYAAEPTTLAFGAPAPVPLGDAPVAPLIRVSHPTTIVYRNSVGEELRRMRIGDFDTSTPFEIDLATGRKNKPADISGPFIRLDPTDGVRGGAAPTLAAEPPVTTAVAVYPLAYLSV